jgi:UDP-N-acetylglucosamine 4,6-dehydratase|tara:strand:+ start:205 stop:1212 length:1008 start_codon:yes stop_codon:yes gene_type:complete
MFKNKNILITGGTGSFGSALIEKIVSNYKPKKIVIYSRDELKQFELKKKFNQKKYSVLRYLIGDVRDKDRLMLAMKDIDYVFHAAALKQVPAAEYNPMECVKTNIVGANNVIECCIFNNVKKVIALSTDKAASPNNLYGASKLVSDKLFVAANNLVGFSPLRFSVVRYGNVAGSRGSVIPEFKKMIDRGADTLPITDKNMTRFWITLEQAINFSIQSMKEMIGGEIFIPKLPSVKIIDLAKSFGNNIKLKYVGLRPGEKIHEIMCSSHDSSQTLEFKKYFVIIPEITLAAKKNKYFLSSKKEKGKLVEENFEYSSGANIHFLTISQIRKINKLLK